MLNISSLETLNALKPTSFLKIIDVVEEAGIAVAAWAVKIDGGVVQQPHTNPAYVNEWAFGGENEPTLLCIWHRSLKVSDDKITFEDCIREYALNLDRLAIDKSQLATNKSRARSQATRARKFDIKVQHAFRNDAPVRVVLLQGKNIDEADLGHASSKVEKRLLDKEFWYVHEYRDSDGYFRLVRKIPAPQLAQPIDVREPDCLDALDDVDAPPYGNSHPVKTLVMNSGFKRDDEVREYVRKRAKGFCEYCDAQGFLLPDGRRYIETHHILWLCDGGPDTVENVIGLCANHHREVHYGQERKVLEQLMVDKLKLRVAL